MIADVRISGLKDPYGISFLLFIVAFISFHIPHLQLPYFWDEAWSYIPAIHGLYKEGPSLLPGALPPDIYRGHPLLFYFLSASWMKIFGGSLVSLHGFALLISILVLWTLYKMGKEFFSPMTGIVLVAISAVQPVFLAQSTALLPEMMLTLWTLLTVYFFLKDNFPAYVLCGFLLLMTKESGLVLIASTGVWVFFEMILRESRIHFKILIKRLVIVSLPVIFASSFFIMQKIKFGWYFFPEHMDMISLSKETILDKFEVCSNFLFKDQHRTCLSRLMAAGMILFVFRLLLARKRKCRVSTDSLNQVKPEMESLQEKGSRRDLGLRKGVSAFFPSGPANNGIPENDKRRIYNQQIRLLSLTLIFMVAYLFFCSLNFVTLRYMLCLIPFWALTGVFFTQQIFIHMNTLTCSLFAFSFLQAVIYSAIPRQASDIDLGYLDGVKIQQDVVRYAEEKNLYEKGIYATFLYMYYFGVPETGYISGKKEFTGLLNREPCKSDYIIYSSIEQDPGFEKFSQECNLVLEKRFIRGRTWAEIYKIQH